VLPSLAVYAELERGDLVSITVSDVELPAYEVALAHWEGRELAPAATAFAETVRGVQVPALLSGTL